MVVKKIRKGIRTFERKGRDMKRGDGSDRRA